MMEAVATTRKEYFHKYYFKNQAKEKERFRVWYAENREGRKEYNKEWRKENPEKQQKYADENRLSINTIKMKYQQIHPEKHRETEHKRRARKQNGICENINSMEIYERDKWVCQICQIKVDKNLKWPNQLSPSLDHIIPLSGGGNHTEDNVQLAHLGCNIRAGIRGTKQLKLSLFSSKQFNQI